MPANPGLVLAAVGGAGGLAGGPGGLIQVLGFPILLIAVFYVMIIMPQQRRAKEHARRIGAVKRGDTVVLSSGLIGKVVRVEDKEVGVEVAQNVTVKVVKSMIAEVRARGEPTPANETKAAKS